MTTSLTIAILVMAGGIMLYTKCKPLTREERVKKELDAFNLNANEKKICKIENVDPINLYMGRGKHK